MSQEVVSQLAPTGVLRAGINLSNFLLVTGRSAAGDPEGVAPDMAREIATRLGVPIKYVPYKTPGELADAAGTGAWDIGLIGAEPQRATKIAFTAAYCEIEATYLVPEGSHLKAIADVDRAGVRIAVTGRSAYGLWLDRNIGNATLVRSDTLDSAYDQFVREKLDALAGLRPRLLSDVKKLPGARASLMASSPPCNRPSARRAKTRLELRSCAPSSRRPRRRGWLPASLPDTRWWVFPSRRRPEVGRTGSKWYRLRD
ncbi:MAG TPA: transporter substrate-binding domain-containing protein [Hyphomicrobiaceae bacterium]|nr:transporter substrate-binding domain-containing protein [Hyphomicrobiaceae bacterium]